MIPEWWLDQPIEAAAILMAAPSPRELELMHRLGTVAKAAEAVGMLRSAGHALGMAYGTLEQASLRLEAMAVHEEWERLNKLVEELQREVKGARNANG